MSVNGHILIDGYELTGCHGVNPEEKVEPQRFVFSTLISPRLRRPTMSTKP